MYLWNHLMNKEKSYAPSVYKKLVMVSLLRLPKVISLWITGLRRGLEAEMVPQLSGTEECPLSVGKHLLVLHTSTTDH
jgi:hypothetical protein